ncbi:STAS domain-containing protein [Actinosynnema sp. NPDC050436]|uniref:STAS domain-containing protein n=1 Tax=Actinosynnema sp. NPDC050436 TaxID=3155659 RepID=UPI0033DDD5F8
MIDSPWMLTVDSETRAAGVVLRVQGDVDMRTAEELESRARDVAAHATPVVLDLTRVGFLGSHGVALLVRLNRLCAENGGRLRVVADHRAVLRPLELTQVLSVLTVVPTLEEALDGPADRR